MTAGAIPRDVAHERRWTLQAAAMANVATGVAQRLVSFAESRTLPGPLRDFGMRRWAHEALEELADTRNYLCWWSLAVVLGDDGNELVGEISEHIGQALAGVIVVYHHVEQARALEVEWRAARP